MAMTAAEARKILEGQRAIIEQVAIEKDYNALYQQLLPVAFGGNPYASAVAFISNKASGDAQWVGESADDIPLADTEAVGRVAPVYTAAIGYGYNFVELGQNPQLTAEKPKAARQAYEKFVDKVAINGDTAKNLKGLTNLGAGDRQRSYDNGTWSGLTGAQIMELVFDTMALTGDDGQIIADTVLLPASLYSKLATTFVTDTRTGLNVLAEANPFTMETGRALTVRGLNVLETAGTSSSNRIITYRNDEDSLKLHIPMPHQFLETYRAGPQRWEVPGMFRIAGLNVVNPKAIAYMDNDAS